MGSNPAIPTRAPASSEVGARYIWGMSFVVYVLESETSGRLYIGQTNNLPRRLVEHAGGYVTATRKKGPWRVLHTWEMETRVNSVRLERRLKALKSPSRVRAEIAADRRE